MAVAVVDGLEAVQVHEQHGETFAVANRLADDGFQSVVEQQPVGQTGERIKQTFTAALLAGQAELQHLREPRRGTMQHGFDDARRAKATTTAGQHGAQHGMPLVVQRHAGEVGQAQHLQQWIVGHLAAPIVPVGHRATGQYLGQRRLRRGRWPAWFGAVPQLQLLHRYACAPGRQRPDRQVIETEFIEQQTCRRRLRIDAIGRGKHARQQRQRRLGAQIRAIAAEDQRHRIAPVMAYQPRVCLPGIAAFGRAALAGIPASIGLGNHLLDRHALEGKHLRQRTALPMIGRQAAVPDHGGTDFEQRASGRQFGDQPFTVVFLERITVAGRFRHRHLRQRRQGCAGKGAGPAPARQQFRGNARGMQPIHGARRPMIGMKRRLVGRYHHQRHVERRRQLAQLLARGAALHAITLDDDHHQLQGRTPFQQDRRMGDIARTVDLRVARLVERVEHPPTQLALLGHDQDARHHAQALI